MGLKRKTPTDKEIADKRAELKTRPKRPPQPARVLPTPLQTDLRAAHEACEYLLLRGGTLTDFVRVIKMASKVLARASRRA